MKEQSNLKVQAHHLSRNAYLYVRQSTLRQVVENTESTKRQYQLRRRAIALGWRDDQIITIDSDLGQSGAHAFERKGFQLLVTEVGMERAGIVLGLEVSRLARNSSDWHKLLELCARANTLILDEDGIYNPTDFNDRLLLGLKGTMSEAEIHVLRSRLRGGLLNKARRGELRTKLPIGFVYDALGKVILDPDCQVQEVVRLLFATYFRLGAAMAAVRYFRKQKIRFPRRVNGGPRHGELVWGRLGYNQALNILRNPRYAGCYTYGRRHGRQKSDGKLETRRLAREDWFSVIQDAHVGYISWEQHLQIAQMLKDMAKAYGQDRRHGPPREGPALLQGHVVCARCGARMSVRYHHRRNGLLSDYFCYQRGPTGSENPCQVIPGAGIDQAIGQLIIETLEPSSLQLAIAVHDEIQERLMQLDKQRSQYVERLQYEADLARQRYMKADPNNRLVVDTLEADWNNNLRNLEQAQRDYAAAHKTDQLSLSEKARQRISNLAEEFPALWNDPETPAKERKRMLGLLIEDVTLDKGDVIKIHVRFRGGATRSLQVPLPLNAWQIRRTSPELAQQIDQLLENHNDLEVAAILSEQGAKTGAKEPWAARSIRWVRYRYQLKSYKQRLQERGLLTSTALCKRLGVSRGTLTKWRLEGHVRAVKHGKRDWLYEVPPLQWRPPQSKTTRPTGACATLAAGGAV